MTQNQFQAPLSISDISKSAVFQMECHKHPYWLAILGFGDAAAILLLLVSRLASINIDRCELGGLKDIKPSLHAFQYIWLDYGPTSIAQVANEALKDKAMYLHNKSKCLGDQSNVQSFS